MEQQKNSLPIIYITQKIYFYKIYFALIILYTINFASGASWSMYSLSYIANFFEVNFKFVIWGVLISIFFFLFTDYTFKVAQYRDKFSINTMKISILLLLFSVTTPYTPVEYPFKSFIHILLSFLAPVFLLLSVYSFTLWLYKKDKKKFIIPLIILNLLVIAAFGILTHYRFINTLLEIFVALSFSLYLFYLNFLF